VLFRSLRRIFVLNDKLNDARIGKILRAELEVPNWKPKFSSYGAPMKSVNISHKFVTKLKMVFIISKKVCLMPYLLSIEILSVEFVSITPMNK